MSKLTNHSLKTGDKVTGKYYGHEFSGVIESRQAIGNYGTNYYIKLDRPVFTEAFTYNDGLCLQQSIKDEENQDLMARHFIELANDYKNLYPKYNCPNCDDWFHMPYKYCKCDSEA